MALLWSLITGTICGVLAGVGHEVGWLYLGGFAAPLVFAFTLVAANAPLPADEDSEVES
jgi:zinc transporter ZupT